MLQLVRKKDDTLGQHSSSIVLNKGIELQHALHIWRENILVWSCLRAHYALRNDTCDVSRSTGILQTLRNTSAQSTVVRISRPI